MRFVYLILVILFVGVTLVFAFENFATVDLTLFGWRLTAPLAAVILSVYVLGMVSGGSVISFLRHSLHRATQPSRRGPKPRREQK